MKAPLSQLLETEDVYGVILFSFQGDVLFREESSSFPDDSGPTSAWPRFIGALEGIREADLVFEKIRLHIRKTGRGYLVIVMGFFAPAAMVRMRCDLLLSVLRQPGRGRGLRGLFKKKS
jgi:hypothetical protein